MPCESSKLSRAGRVLAGCALSAILASCASGPATERRIETSRIVAASPEELIPRIEAFLVDRQIEVVRTDPSTSLIEARQRPLSNRGWAEDCGPLYVRDSDGERRRQARLLERRLELTIVVDPLSAQTLVTVQPAFIGTFHNSFTNDRFEARCGSSQQLERALLDAL